MNDLVPLPFAKKIHMFDEYPAVTLQKQKKEESVWPCWIDEFFSASPPQIKKIGTYK